MKDLELARECGGTDLYEITEHITDINVMVLRPDQLSTFASRVREQERERCAKELEISTQEMLLMAGEMTASEIRCVKAVLKALAWRIRSLGGEESHD